MARTNKSRAPALAYLRTSSAANVGTDKDSEKRQRHAIRRRRAVTAYLLTGPKQADLRPANPATLLAGPNVTKILLRSLGCIPKMRLLCW